MSKDQTINQFLFINRFDSKTLLQKYVPETSSNGGDQRHKAANLYSGFVPWNKSKYSSVAVNFLSADKSLVKIVKIAGQVDKK